MNTIANWRNRTPTIVHLAILTFILLLSVICAIKYFTFRYTDFDLAIDAQSLWNLAHFSAYSSLHGMIFLGNHMRLILFLFAPFYALFPSPLLLPLLQAVLLGLAAYPLHAIAKRNLPPPWPTLLVLLYLVYPPLWLMALYEFHPVALATSFLLFAMHAYTENRFPRFLLFLLLAITCQENIPLIAAGLGLYAWLDGRRGKWVFTPLLGGVACFILFVFYLMPLFNQDRVQLERLYSHLGPTLGQALLTLLQHPLHSLALSYAPEKATFANALLAPLGYTSLFAPLQLIPLAPVALQRYLSIRAAEASILCHYQAEFIPFLFLAAIHGVRRILTLPHPRTGFWLRSLVVLLTACALACGPLPAILAADILPSESIRQNTAAYRHILGLIPNNAAVAATFRFLPALANRANLYSLHHAATGLHTLSTAAYRLPPVDFWLIDTNDPLTFSDRGFYDPAAFIHLQNTLTSHNWSVACKLDSILLLTPEPGPWRNIPDIIEPLPNLPPETTPAHTLPSPPPGLIAYHLNNTPGTNSVNLDLFWQTTNQPLPDMNLCIQFRTAANHVHSLILSPGKRIAPPQSWPAHTCIRDSHCITPPAAAPGTAPQLLSIIGIPAQVVN